MSIKVSRFLDVADGLQANQFSIGSRDSIESLDELDAIYKQLIDKPITCVMAVMGKDGRPNLSSMWFDYAGDKVFINVASQRKKTEWIRANPQVTIHLMNPENPYHWMSLKVTVEEEISEDDPDRGAAVTAQLNKSANKYTGADYGLRDPSIDERRIQFVCGIDSIATFGKP